MTDTLIWITGGSSGLGAALAQTNPYRDAHVVSISRSAGPPGTEHLPADLADPASWSAIETHLLARMSSFSGSRLVFVHNAGTLTPIGFAGEVDTVPYRDNVLLNSAAGQVLGHAFLKAVRASGFAGETVLVMISSGAASAAYPGWSAYCAGKAALDQWVRAAGEEQRTRDEATTVLSIAPGVVATPMQAEIRSADQADFPNVARFHQLHEQGQLREPDDAARAVWDVVGQGLQAGTVTDVRGSN
jgi:NAD(P)-dependent dehydrogenase (short-subunit alcohol dehydrogenase family)